MKFGIREICNVVLKAKTNGLVLGKPFEKGQPVLWFDSLKTSGLEGTGEIVYARGGRGNTKLVSWTGDKEITFTMEDALISPMSLTLLTAGSIKKANEDDFIVVHQTIEINSKYNTQSGFEITEEIYNVLNSSSDYPVAIKINDIYHNFTDDDDMTFTLSEDGEKYYLTYDDLKGISSIPGNDDILQQIDYYVKKQSKFTQIDISPESFGVNFYLEAETLFREQGTGVDHPAEFIIPDCRVQSNFSLSMASTGDPSTFTFTMDAFPGYIDEKATKKVLCAIQVFEESTSV